MALEDFTTYTEVDPNSDITIIANEIDVDTMRRDVEAGVYKDDGISYFGDLTHLFDSSWDAADNQGLVGVWGLSNGPYRTIQEMGDADEGLVVSYYNNSGNFQVYLIDYGVWPDPAGVDYHDFGGAPPGLYYYEISRSGTAATLNIYSDAERTVLVDTLSIICALTVYRYLHAVLSQDNDVDPAATITVTVKNLDIGTCGAIQDAALDLSTYYQRQQDFSLLLDAIGWNIDFGDRWSDGDLWDAWSRWGYLPVPPPYYDLAALLDVLAQDVTDMIALLEAAGFSFIDLGAFLEATDGAVLEDFATWLRATDGTTFDDASFWLRAIGSVPIFKSITAQKVSSVVHEVEI